MIVIDVGCATRGPEESVRKLIDRFHPGFLYGFDPGAPKSVVVEDGSRVIIQPKAAWVWDGVIGWHHEGITSRADSGYWLSQVECFDLTSFIIGLPDGRIVLKIDAEGAEYTLLPHLHESGADALLELLLVEWHCTNCGIGGGEHAPNCAEPNVPVVEGLRCPVELW